MYRVGNHPGRASDGAAKGYPHLYAVYRNRMMKKKEQEKIHVKKQGRIRIAIQLVSMALFNGYAVGFASGKIFTGSSKRVCVPVLNCYSCPGALGACPIGALQSVQGSHKYHISFYVIGMLMLFGLILGRLICGFLCPFGLVQDLLHRISIPKLSVPQRLDKALRYVKYGVVALLVIILPIALTNKYGMGEPYFCKWLCPSGTLGGALPLCTMDGGLRSAVGLLFGWKVFVLVLILVASTLVPRPFCRYLCPLGAIYGLFSRFSFYRMQLDKEKCISCHACEKACPMQVDILKNINSPECIRCGKCKAVCSTKAIQSGFFNHEK